MTITDSPALAVIWTSRPRSFPVGMAETARRKSLPRLPREGRLPARSRPSARASAKSRSSMTKARAPRAFAVAIKALIAAQMPVAGGRRQAGQVQTEGGRDAQDVAVWRDDRHCEMTVVDVDGHDWVLPQFIQRCRRGGHSLPARVDVPAAAGRVVADVVAHRA